MGAWGLDGVGVPGNSEKSPGKHKENSGIFPENHRVGGPVIKSGIVKSEETNYQIIPRS